MFPHMYKVRPPRSQQTKHQQSLDSPQANMSTECHLNKEEDFSKNRWSKEALEGGGGGTCSQEAMSAQNLLPPIPNHHSEHMDERTPIKLKKPVKKQRPQEAANENVQNQLDPAPSGRQRVRSRTRSPIHGDNEEQQQSRNRSLLTEDQDEQESRSRNVPVENEARHEGSSSPYPGQRMRSRMKSPAVESGEPKQNDGRKLSLNIKQTEKPLEENRKTSLNEKRTQEAPPAEENRRLSLDMFYQDFFGSAKPEKDSKKPSVDEKQNEKPVEQPRKQSANEKRNEKPTETPQEARTISANEKRNEKPVEQQRKQSRNEKRNEKPAEDKRKLSANEKREEKPAEQPRKQSANEKRNEKPAEDNRKVSINEKRNEKPEAGRKVSLNEKAVDKPREESRKVSLNDKRNEKAREIIPRGKGRLEKSSTAEPVEENGDLGGDEAEIDYEKAMKMWVQQNSEDDDTYQPFADDITVDDYQVDVSEPDWLTDKTKKKPAVVDEWGAENLKKEKPTSSIPTPPKLRPVVIPPCPPGPPPPPPPPGPPMAPPMPGSAPSGGPKKMKAAQLRLLEQIRKASRTRPDWSSVMKDLEGSAGKLKHVATPDLQDRSKPILPQSRGKNGAFVYESEKPNSRNLLIREIQRGVCLRKVRTNDRSKPDFHRLGLRKLRRQVTQEKEQKAGREALPSSSDEEEDIDTMRDDLQATKTQLSDEIKKSKKMEKTEKIWKIDLESLTAEVRNLKRRLKEAGIHDPKVMTEKDTDAIGPKLSKSMSRLRMREEQLDFSDLDDMEGEINTLNGQIEAQRKRAEKAEQKGDELTMKLKISDGNADEWELRAIYFEKKYKAMQREQGTEPLSIGCIGVQTDPVEFVPEEVDTSDPLFARRSSSRKSLGSVFKKMESFQEEEEDSESSDEESDDESVYVDEEYQDDENSEEEVEEAEGELTEEEKVQKELKRKERDLQFWENKYSHMVEREYNVKRERNNLRERLKKYFRDMTIERLEFLKVKTELDELAEVNQPSDIESEEEEEEEGEELPPENEDGEFWFDMKKPKKLKRRKKKHLNTSGELEEEEESEEEEDLEDLTELEEPEWDESDEEDSDQIDDSDPIECRIRSNQEKTRRSETKMSAIKKDNYLLKTQMDRAEEMFAIERRRHTRLDNELQIILTSI